MKFLSVILLAMSVSALPMSVATAADGSKTNPRGNLTPRADGQLGTSEMKWKPTGEQWVECVQNGLKCRCSGDVVDCRGATAQKPATTKAKQ